MVASAAGSAPHRGLAMKRSLLIYVAYVLTIHVGCGGALADLPGDQPEAKVVTIPLDQIWGYNMPGTRDVQKLEADTRSLLFMQIRRSLWPFPSKDKDAEAGFAVLGTGLQALREVHGVLVEKKKPRETFPTGREICVVFFSYQNTLYVHLRGGRREGNTVEIRYVFVPHETEDTTEHFALIPLGTLPIGMYHGNIIQSPMDRKYV